VTLAAFTLWIFAAGILTGAWVTIVATILIPDTISIWQHFSRNPDSIRRDRALGKFAAKLFTRHRRTRQ